MLRLIIIDDEYSPRQMLRSKLEQHFPDMEIVAECDSAEDALIGILRLRPDLLFLDIEMSGKNGLWLADELLRMKGETFAPPDVIFTTGYTYSEYLLKAVEGENCFCLTLHRLLNHSNDATGDKYLIPLMMYTSVLKVKRCPARYTVQHVRADEDKLPESFSIWDR